jgi:hypothetical protein
MERLKNAGLVFCLFVVLLVIFNSYFRATEIGALFGALAGTPVLIHVFNRLVPPRRDSYRGGYRQESWWRGLSRCRRVRSKCWCFAWRTPMGSGELPFLITATVLVGAKALTLAIQTLVRMP